MLTIVDSSQKGSMDVINAIPKVNAFDISIRGRIDSHSGWHAAEKRVNELGARADKPSPAWPLLIASLGGTTALANRKLAELQPTITAVNRIVDALNVLPDSSTFADLEIALGLVEPHELHDRIGDAMARVMRNLKGPGPLASL
jgi:hypothetical protein